MKSSEATPLVKGGDDEMDPAKKMKTAASIALLIGTAVLKTQLTAFLFSYSNTPTAYSFYSCVVTCVLLLPVFVIWPKLWAVPTVAMSRVLGLIIFFTAGDMGLTNIALAELTTALQTSIASTNPFWAMWIEACLYRKLQHVLVILCVTLLVVGAILSSLGTISKISALGIFAACVAVLCSASKYVFTHNAMKEFKGHLGGLALLFWVDLFLIPIYLVWLLIAWAAGNDELIVMFSEMFQDASLFWQVTATAALGGFRALTQYWVLAFVTATSMSSANIFVQVLNVLISIPIQHTPVTGFLAAGVSLTTIFSFAYAYIKSNKWFLPWFDDTVGCTPKKALPEAA